MRTSVAINDDWKVDCTNDTPGHVKNLGLREDTEVGLAQIGGCHRVARYDEGVEASPLGELGTQHIMNATGNENLVSLQERMQFFALCLRLCQRAERKVPRSGGVPAEQCSQLQDWPPLGIS